jgi:hypothetical protein
LKKRGKLKLAIKVVIELITKQNLKQKFDSRLGLKIAVGLT